MQEHQCDHAAGVGIESTDLPKPCYFLISVSTRLNLELCIKHGLAGFPSSAKGAWTFEEIQEGDFLSFLHGAKAYNLYRVVHRESIRNAEVLPPWPLITSKLSGKTYSFPFRLSLEPIRIFTEALVRIEFAYVAENLLLRGGYRKTHFQADQTTLQNASGMGTLADAKIDALELPPHETFTPRYTRKRNSVRVPEVIPFEETILQAAIRHWLLDENELRVFLREVGIEGISAPDLEVLGEKAFPEGHVDILLKERVPLGSAKKVVLEVKLGAARVDDLDQLQGYVDQLGAECKGAILVGAKFGKGLVQEASARGVKLARYSGLDPDWAEPLSFREICEKLNIEPIQ